MPVFVLQLVPKEQRSQGLTTCLASGVGAAFIQEPTMEMVFGVLYHYSKVLHRRISSPDTVGAGRIGVDTMHHGMGM